MLHFALLTDDITLQNMFITSVGECFKQMDMKVVLHQFLDSNKLLNCIKKFDVIFIDIELSNKNGIEISKAIRKKDKVSTICFIGESSDFNFNMFHLHIFDCLKKPITNQKLTYLFAEIIQYLDCNNKQTKLCFTSINGMINVNIDDILYIEYCESSDHCPNRSVILHTIYNQYILRTNITTLYQKLDNDHFQISHQSFIVNLFRIQLIRGYEIVLCDGTKIPLAQKRAVAFRKEFQKIK